MPPITVSLAAVIFAAGDDAGAFGIVLRLGGGIFLVPFLALALGFPVKWAVAISLTTVLARPERDQGSARRSRSRYPFGCNSTSPDDFVLELQIAEFAVVLARLHS